jgi:acetolactate synthase-1/2/3 large subunit
MIDKMAQEKYADLFVDWLIEAGYTTCFFVAGGNSMHLLNACRKKFRCIPFVHEVSAGIAAEYFNEVSSSGRSFVLVTAGPGLTNLVTAISGAWLESRELLIIGGQVKSTDLADGDMRQRGIQEVNGVEIVRSITKANLRLTKPVARSVITNAIYHARTPRKGPCFIEICLDVQATPVSRSEFEDPIEKIDSDLSEILDDQISNLQLLLQNSERPVALFGGGLDRKIVNSLATKIDKWGVPILTSWNGADRYASDRPSWFGRPDTWGMRFSNAIIQKSDLVIAFGARLSYQQTGFNWTGFAPNAKIVHIDIDKSELDKGHPRTQIKICSDANQILQELVDIPLDKTAWLALCRKIKDALPLNDEENSRHTGFLQPYEFTEKLATLCNSKDMVFPCSSGGANTVLMQSFRNKTGQFFFNNKALASMGYGLAGSIGASFAHPERRTILVEGDGGFAQNLQELATVSVNSLNLKIFLFANNGYASIRMTQKNYFDGAYLGCDVESGLGFPDWGLLCTAFGLNSIVLSEGFESNSEFLTSWNSSDPYLYVVPIHPEQTYYPKISSQVTSSGSMESAPLHKMTPPLSDRLIVDLGLEI